MGSFFLRAVFPGAIYIIPIHLIDSIGLQGANLVSLAMLRVYLASLERPWMIIGDCYLSPEVLATSGWVSLVQGYLSAPDEHTC